MAVFSRYIGIDYSGAETPESSLKGLRVYCAVGESEAKEVAPPPSPRKYWTRRGIAHWLAERLAEDVPTIVGIDHGFSFPLRYFEVHGLLPDWPTFLEDVGAHTAPGSSSLTSLVSGAPSAPANVASAEAMTAGCAIIDSTISVRCRHA